jgi:hypothetical protein
MSRQRSWIRVVGQALLVLGAAVDAFYLVIFGLANLAQSGDILPAPVVGAWTVPTGLIQLLFAIAGIRWDRAAAGAAATASLPLVYAVSLALDEPGALSIATVIGGAAIATIVGAALRLRS